MKGKKSQNTYSSPSPSHTPHGGLRFVVAAFFSLYSQLLMEGVYSVARNGNNFSLWIVPQWFPITSWCPWVLHLGTSLTSSFTKFSPVVPSVKYAFCFLLRAWLTETISKCSVSTKRGVTQWNKVELFLH